MYFAWREKLVIYCQVTGFSLFISFRMAFKASLNGRNG